jgi:dipeptidase E
MMNIYLASQASKVLDKIVPMLPKKPEELKLAFVPTASDPYEERPWLDSDRAKLTELGFQMEDFDLKNKTEDEVRKKLSEFDIVFVAGGNTFYLLDEVKKSGFDKVIKEFIRAGKIYIGSSAGSYILCPTIEASGWKKSGRNIVNLTDLSALNLVDFIVVAHYTDEWKKAVENGKKTTKYNVIALTDDQFIVSDGEGYEIIG